MEEHNTFYPTQNIKVDFVRLQDMGYENLGSLMQCNLCDTIKVIFPDYNSTGTYKIVKTVWNVLENRYEEMELGQLSTSLAEALGISNSLGGGGGEDLNDYLKKIDLAPSFVAETYNHSYSNIASGGAMEWSETKTKAGYYPLGVIGFSTTRAVLLVSRARITAASSGSCTFELYARAVAAANASTAYITVLWVKA